MTPEELMYEVETRKSVSQASVAVLKAVEQKGWTVFGVYDVQERLASKGFEQKPLRIIEICSGKYAHQFLNKNRRVSLCMPCKINVLEDEGTVKILGMRPTMVSQFFPEISRQEAEQAEKDLIGIIDDAR